MKSPAIPEIVDPTKSCDKKLTYNGLLRISKLPRFLEAQADMADVATSVEVAFSFRRDEQQLKVADLQFTVLARLTCQRCLQVMESKCEGNTTFVFCKDIAKTEQVPKGYEPALITGNKVNLWQLLEDELLLSLPMFAYHADVHCNEVLNTLSAEPVKREKVSPFAVLGELLKK